MIFPTSPIQVLPQIVRTEIKKDGSVRNFKESESEHHHRSNKIYKNEDLEKINEKIWNSIKNEIKHDKERIDCKRIIEGDEDYIKLEAKSRLTYKDTKHLLMDCRSIKERNYFLEKPNEEKKYPLAYARIVYGSYRFLEAEFATNYQHQNWYCYAVDSKIGNKQFFKRIKSLAKCFPNVIVPTKRFPVNKDGVNMVTAFMSCLEELSKKKYKWEYVFTLQNFDIQIKTNEEIIQILKWLGGANDVEYSLDKKELIQALYKKFNWTFKDLKLFKDEKLNNQVDTEGKPLSLKITKGYIQASLARPFVDFIVQKLDLTQLLDHLNNCGEYGCDELFFQSLLATDVLKAPNSFTHKCVDKNISTPYAVNLRDNNFLFANKIKADFDFGAILCWHEEMRSRALKRFHKEMVKTGKVDIDKFNCDINKN
uniref:Uncharacterized protein n=1 Tax=Meloidogyne floridensis TaxID=298350 RepID=A0A915NJV5_9BILA